ncbi:MAG: alkaline phosphatase [Acidobacteria bacterium]|nr:alkaline phosphatase [Acidobacteriota bacterium]
MLYLLLLLAAVWAQEQPDHVIVIGADGLGAEGLRKAKAPNLRELMARGAWTLHARGVFPTISSPNWASMIMGATPAQHGIASNEWQPDKPDISPVCTGMASIFPTIFGTLRQQRPSSRIAIFHDWEDFARLVESKAADVVRHVKGSAAAADAAIAYWRERKPLLLFLHLDDVDHAGHDHGWLGFEYMAAVGLIDAQVGKVNAAVRQAGLLERTAILLSADHGGAGTRHGGTTLGELEIPWILAGPGIVKGKEILTPVNTYDTAATLAMLLKVRPPACWIGRPVEEAFERR